MHIRIADFAADYAEIRNVRFTVFVEEQQVPESIEIDDRDQECIHVLAFDRDEPIGTGRIDMAKLGRVGRLAVLAANRGQGVGTAIVEFLHDIAKQNELDSVWLHAQTVALPFYEKLGYQVVSDPFFEANIEHVTMQKEL